MTWDSLRDLFFHPPPMPDLDLPFGYKMAGAASIFGDAFKLAYWNGVKDGLQVGVILCLAAIVLITFRATLVKGVVSVLS